MLKNDQGLLPLGGQAKRILVTGFAANSKKMLNGAWTLEWLGAEEERQPKNMKTLIEAISYEFPEAQVSLFETGLDGSIDSEEAFLRACRQSDLVILTMGEQPYSEFRGNITDLNMSNEQKHLARLAAQTQTPMVYVLIQGRPRLITDIEPLADAILFAGYPGQGGADAIAGILSGRINPSGRLSFSYPLYPGHIVPYYHKAFDRAQNLYGFGHGLSYSTFEYSNLRLSSDIITEPGKALTVSFDIKNLSDIPGKEVVLGYFRQEKGHITRPVRQLFHFSKIHLKGGETTTVVLPLYPAKTFSYPNENNEMILEKGVFTIMVGGMEKKLDYL